MTIILLITLTIQLGYWIFLYNKLGINDGYLTKMDASSQVSVILCFKNGINQLKTNLAHIIKQNHPNYAIILADDFSTDGSTEYIKGIDSEKLAVHYYKVKQNMHGKKQALQEAIAFSKSEFLLLTDNDCKPASDNWISLMTRALETKDIVLGYSPYVYEHTALSLWVHFEGWITAVQYLSYSIVGIPYMGVGRNVAYKKSLWQDPKLNLHRDLSSGDDDLFINQLATKTNTAICLDKDSFVYTQSPANLKAYFNQKRRHYSTANRYKTIHKILLSTYSLSQVCFYTALILTLINGSYKIAVGAYLLRLIIMLPIVNRLRKLLNAAFGLIMYPILDFFQAIHYLIFSFTVFIPQKNKW